MLLLHVLHVHSHLTHARLSYVVPAVSEPIAQSIAFGDDRLLLQAQLCCDDFELCINLDNLTALASAPAFSVSATVEFLLVTHTG